MASNLTKWKRDEPEPGHKPDEDLCWSGHQCVPSPPLSLSSHSIYLSSADIDAVLIIATNYPWRCTPLVSHRSSLATPLREAPPSPSARANPHPLARCAPMCSTQSTTSHTKRAASTPPRLHRQIQRLVRSAHPLESVGETFPRSPTMSVFSIPSGRESATYSSVAHLPLRAGSPSALAMLPPSPPAQRERRRLRKKSRPPDNNVFELLDRQQDIAPLPSPPQPSSPSPGPVDLPPSETSNSSRSSILSRIGSVKRWGVHKRFTSPGPSDTADDLKAERDATPRAPGFQPQTPSQTPSWFF